MKRRGAGGLLDVLKAQHFDAGVSLARRLGIMLARFSGIGSTNKDPQVVTGTLGRLASAFLMQLVASPASRPSYGHLWGIGGIPAIYNGDGTATPCLDLWADKDTDVAALAVDVGTQSVSSGDFGLIFCGTNQNAQSLVFFKGSTSSAGSGDWDYYGDGVLGSLTAPTDTTSWAGFATSYLTAGGSGAPWGIPDGIYIHVLPVLTGGPGQGEFLFQDLTIPSGVVVVARGVSSGDSHGNTQPVIIRCKGTLTVDGELSASGDYFGFIGAGNGAQGGISGGTGMDGASYAYTFPDLRGPPFDEGAASGDTTKYSGAGGSSGVLHVGGSGGGAGYPPKKPSDGGVGRLAGSSPWLRSLPGAAYGSGNSVGGTLAGGPIGDVTFCGAGGGGGGSSTFGTGGKGGAGGGCLGVCARKIKGSGKITSNGGRGRAGSVVLAGYGGGGGGGGNPGAIPIVSESVPGITIQHVPGAGGAGAGLGSAGSSGGGAGWHEYFVRS